MRSKKNLITINLGNVDLVSRNIFSFESIPVRIIIIQLSVLYIKNFISQT